MKQTELLRNCEVEKMSNSANIYPKCKKEYGEQIGLFMEEHGSPRWVYSILKYLRMLGFPSPSTSGAGMARLIQVVSNFGTDDPYEVVVGLSDDLPCVCYGYEIDGWEFSNMEKYGEDFDKLNIERFLRTIDLYQTEELQLGDEMIHVLYERNETVKDLCIDYHQQLRNRERRGIDGKPFVKNRQYTTYNNTIRVVEKKDTSMIVNFEDSIQEVPLYKWIDGSESTVVVDFNKKKQYPILSVKEASLSLSEMLDGFNRSRSFEYPESEEDEEIEES